MTAGDARLSPARYRAYIAAVITSCRVPISDLAHLTDRQIFGLYGHERDKDGKIKVPDDKKDAAEPDASPPSLERDLRDLWIAASTFRMPPEKYAELKRQLEAKWAAKTEDTSNG